mmetsp:Transcript_13349/g.25614  ORF Transcript_13349/g.25614 Transcript_13349/m.25614 type:complete len:203 (+) Transcript_13349:1161-1769(+)
MLNSHELILSCTDSLPSSLLTLSSSLPIPFQLPVRVCMRACDPRDFGFKLLCEVDWSIIMLRGRVSFLPPRSAVPSSCSSCGMLDRRRTLSEMDAIISCLSSSLSESTLSRLGWLRSARSSAGEQALPGGDTMGDPVEVVAILPKRAVPYECRARRERRCTSRTPVTCVLMRARRLIKETWRGSSIIIPASSISCSSMLMVS